MAGAIFTAKIRFDQNKVQSISDFSYSNASDKNALLEEALSAHLNEAIKGKINDLIESGIISNNYCYIQVLDGNRVRLFNPTSSYYPKIDITRYLPDSIKNSLEIYKAPNISAKKSQSLLKSAFKCFLNGLDFIFVQKLYHAKLADIAVLSLFSFTILATALTIFAPHLSILHLASMGSFYSHPAFGALNITVGLAIFTQASKNLLKAKKNQNKEEIILALISVLFSFAVISTGITATCNFSNDFMLKSLFTTCASFTFGVGIYNTIKTQLFRKKLNDAENLKDFFEKQLKISDDESKKIHEEIIALKDLKEIEKYLKKFLSKKDFEEIKEKNKELLKEKLIELKHLALERKKRAVVEKILGSEITKKAINLIKNGIEDPSLAKDIKKALFIRNIADTLRIVATSLAIGAFGFNTLSPIENINIQNLTYYSTMLVSKLSGFWQNYFPIMRNVPATDNKKNKKNIKSTKISPVGKATLQESN